MSTEKYSPYEVLKADIKALEKIIESLQKAIQEVKEAVRQLQVEQSKDNP